jgi:hypothetical protein
MVRKYLAGIWARLDPFIVGVLVRVLQIAPAEFLAWYFRLFLRAWEKKGRHWITFHTRPKATDELEIEQAQYCPNVHPRTAVAVVIQGPLVQEDNFTFETVRLYQRSFKDAIVVVSTWSDAKEEQLARVRDLDVVVLANQKPRHAGYCNLNYQLVSSLAGVTEAKRLGAEYVLKTRSDQRLHAKNLAAHLLSLLGAFPLKAAGQSERIIALSHTVKYIPYHVCDFAVFGHVSDMEVYWSAEPDQRSPVGNQPCQNTVRDWMQRQPPEVYLGSQFLKNTGWPLQWTISDSLRAYASRFCIIDYEMLDIYWPKHARHLEYRHRCYRSTTRQGLTYLEWLSLVQQGVTLNPAIETILDASNDGTVPVR